jgi:hypothetical protein
VSASVTDTTTADPYQGLAAGAHERGGGNQGGSSWVNGETLQMYPVEEPGAAQGGSAGLQVDFAVKIDTLTEGVGDIVAAGGETVRIHADAARTSQHLLARSLESTGSICLQDQLAVAFDLVLGWDTQAVDGGLPLTAQDGQ